MDPNVIKTTSITKFNVAEKTLYVKLIWNPNDSDLFHIKIFDGDVTWSGKFSNESAKKYGDRCDETEEQYIKHVKRYLKEGSNSNEVTYDFVINREDNGSAKFTWKKRFEDEGSIVHGVVPVSLDKSVEAKDVLLDFLLEENRDLRTTIDSLHSKNDIIATDLKKCKSELEKFVDIKTSLEASLYAKFVQLLNAKKRRIQVLEGDVPMTTDSRDLGGDH